MNRLKELRKEKGLTQQGLADDLGVSKRTYIYWENGESQIKSDKAQQLADYFGVSVAYLLGYSHHRDEYEVRQQLNKKDPNDWANPIKARIATILGDDMLEELENQYMEGGRYNPDPDFSTLMSFLSAVNSLSYTPEEELLLNYGILPKADKQIVKNLVAEMADKVKKPPKENNKWEF